MKRPLLTICGATLIVVGALAGSSTFSSAEGVDIGFVAAANPRIDGTLPNAEQRILKLGMNIFQNEFISTSQIGSGQFIFLDQTTLTVSPGSEIVLDRYVFDVTRDAGEIVLTLSKGVLRFIGGRITKSSEGIINTPHATIGIRGGIAAITVGDEGTNAVLLAGESMRVTGATKTIIVTRAGGMVTVPAPESESSETAGEDADTTESESSESTATETETTETETTEPAATEPAPTDPLATDPLAADPVATEPVSAELGEPVYEGVITADTVDDIYESTDTGGDGGTTQPPDPVIIEASITDSGLGDIGAEAPDAVEQPPVSTEGEEAPDNADDSAEPDSTAPDPIDDIATDPDTTDPPEDPSLEDILLLATSNIPNTWSPSVPITHAFTGGYAAGRGQSTIPGDDPDPYVMRSPDGDGVIMGFDTAGNAVFAEFGPLDTFGSADIDDITLNFGSGASSVAFLDDNVFSIDAPDSETGALTGQTQSISGFFGTDPDIDGQTAMSGTVLSSGFVSDDFGIVFPENTDTTPEYLRWGSWSADYQFDDTNDSPGGVAPRSETISGTWVDGVRTDDIAVLGTSGEAQFSGLATAHVTGGSGPELQGGSFTLIYDFGDRSGAVSITGIAETTFFSTVTGAPTGSGNHFGGELLDFSQVDPLVGSIDGSFFTGAGDLTAATGGAFDFERQISGSVTQTGAGIFAADKVTN